MARRILSDPARLDEWRVLSKTRTFNLWNNLRSRSKRKLAAGRIDGGRFCARLDTDFLAFVDVVGPDPGPTFAIGRADVLGQWSCGDCDDCRAAGLAANVVWLPKRRTSGCATAARQRAALADAGKLGEAPAAIARLAAVERELADLRTEFRRLLIAFASLQSALESRHVA